eukprot:TRINITY_DN22341_c0_g1_i1.p1 TRINITY_DN22341_c0_g1~~TRINITY_DN22341_c0_g1_i1.p1  ORF type:complete len:157 (+),score=49.73 TRINITY_DN22341_c0_g1_i1:179-649(+)
MCIRDRSTGEEPKAKEHYMVNVSIKRIEHDLFELSKFGFNEEDKGVYRQGFTDADMAARKWLINLLEQEGMSARMDGAGNVIGRYGEMDRPAVMIGSHLDSVPAGGIYDGTLGVIAGVECVRTIKENSICLLYTSDAADDLLCVDLGGRRIIKKKN